MQVSLASLVLSTQEHIIHCQQKSSGVCSHVRPCHILPEWLPPTIPLDHVHGSIGVDALQLLHPMHEGVAKSACIDSVAKFLTQVKTLCMNFGLV